MSTTKDFYFNFEKKEVFYTFREDIKITFGNKLFTDDFISMPFEISQSIIGGERFFWFVMKYSELIDRIKNKVFYKKLDSTNGTGNLYLKKIYKSALFFYFDKFGEYKFDEFAISLSKLLIIFRISHDSMPPATITNFKCDGANTFDIKSIYLNSASEDIISQIEQYVMYANKKFDNNSNTKEQFISCFCDILKIKEYLEESNEQ